MAGLTHTLQPGNRVPGYFTQENLNRISCIVTRTLAKEYRQKIVMTPSSIMREMDLVHNERPTTVPDMNRRVALNLLRAFRNETAEIERANYFLDRRWEAYNYDPSLGIQPFETPKLKTNTPGLRFAYTF